MNVYVGTYSYTIEEYVNFEYEKITEMKKLNGKEHRKIKKGTISPDW
jgi:hypothetical protein